MTPESQRIAIAEACGWKLNPAKHTAKATDWLHAASGNTAYGPPDYANSLDAMHEAEKVKEMHWDQRWVEAIVRIGLREAAMDYPRTNGWDWVLIVSRLSAAQRAEAFLRTLNLWTE